MELGLKWHTFIRLQVPLMVAILIIILVPIISLYSNVSKWRDLSANFMETATLKASQLRLNKVAEEILLSYGQVSNDLSTITNYTSDAINHNIPVKQYLRTYYGDTTIDISVPPRDYEHYHKYSASFKLGITDMQSLMNVPYINETSLFDIIARVIYKSSAGLYINIFLGLNNGLYRRYPYSPLPSAYSIRRYCIKNDNTGLIGFDPRCRPWYAQTTNNYSAVFTTPYMDADDATQKSLIVASKAMYVNNVLFGVIGIEFDMAMLDSKVHQTKILTNGYVFLMDMIGTIVSYPNLNRKTTPLTDVFHIEPFITTTIWNQILASFATSTVPLSTIKSKDNSIWYIHYYYVNNANQYLVMMIPNEDLHVPSNELYSTLSSRINLATIVVSVVITVISIIVFVYFFRQVTVYSDRLKKISNIFTEIRNGNLDVVIDNNKEGGGDLCPEITEIKNKSKNMLLVTKLNANNYYNGKPEQALQDFEKVLEYQIKIKNIRGQGAMYNNIGAVYKKLCMFETSLERKNLYCKRAESNYQKAINISLAEQNQNQNQNQNNLEALKKINISLGIRTSNLGVLYQDIGITSKAMTRFMDSQTAYCEADYRLGIAQVSCNIGQIHMQNNRFEEAEKLLLKTYQEIVHKAKDDVSLQYLTRNLGLIYEKQGKYDEAIKYFHHNFDGYEQVDKEVQDICIVELIKCYKAVGNHEMANRLKEFIKKQTIKNVMFVLDCSSSMSSIVTGTSDTYIEVCRRNIEHIVEKYMVADDFVSLYTFNTQWRQVFQLMCRGEQHTQNYSRIINAIRTETDADGDTAFYDALYNAIFEARKLGNDKNKKWIVALTDGVDNQSRTDPKDIINILCTEAVSLIIMTIGNLRNERIILDICHAANKYGTAYHIKIAKGCRNDADNTTLTLDQAFVQVAKMISGQTILEHL